MLSTTARRLLSAGSLLLLPASLVACGGGSSTRIGAAPASSSTSATAPSTARATTGSAETLSKAQFLERTNTICAAINTKLKMIPEPASDTDYPAISSAISTTVKLFDSYVAQIGPLVNRSDDKAVLTTKWLAVEKADFDAVRPLLGQFQQAVATGNDAAIESASKKLAAAPDHTDQLISFLSAYGLTSCAKLESDSQGGALSA